MHDISSSDNLSSVLTKFAWAISAIAFIIAVLGIINTMVTSVLEQTRELGILISIGWRKTRIIALILCESMLLSFLGGLIGVALGYCMMNIMASTPQLQNISRINYDPVFVLKTLFISIVIGLVAGVYPALKAILIEPIEVLRYE